jgi:hypothetical protein
VSTDIADSLKNAEEMDASRWIAVYIAVLAVFLSIRTVGGGNSTKDATRANIQPPILGLSIKPKICATQVTSSRPMGWS